MQKTTDPIIPGAIYHVTNRGNRKAVIFVDDYDRRRFRDYLVEALAVCGVKLLAESPMTTHFHLDLVPTRANLSEFMAKLEGPYAKYFNARHDHVGHLFQGPFRRTLVESDHHLFTTLWYIYMNPVTSGIVDAPEKYPWSSYAATVGLAKAPDFLSLDWLEVLFPGDSVERSQRRLRDVMSDPRPLEAFHRETPEDLDPVARQRPVRSYVWEQRQEGVAFFANRPRLEELGSPCAHDRAQFIHDARVVHGYRLAEIARHLHMNATTVGEIFDRMRRPQSMTTVSSIEDTQSPDCQLTV